MDAKKNVVKYRQRRSFLAHFAPAPELSANLMKITPFHLKLKLLVEKINGSTLAMNLLKITTHSSLTQLRTNRRIKCWNRKYAKRFSWLRFRLSSPFHLNLLVTSNNCLDKVICSVRSNLMVLFTLVVIIL